MTYCVGVKLNSGLVFMSDTRTNAGVDNVSVFRKMFFWDVPGDRSITILTAGNLATTQTTIGLLHERTKAPGARSPSILRAETMFQVAQIVGRTLREVIAEYKAHGHDGSADFTASLIVGGQIAGAEPTLFLVYPEGNFIEASDDTPFLQIGETKYGRPILVRVYEPDMTFADTVKLLMVSFDSTIKANLSVGLPLDLAIYEAGTLDRPTRRRIVESDREYRAISDGWADALRVAFKQLPDVVLDDT
ncbi:MAG: proteasome-type protease [Acidimicrobiia bacterium]|nr:proteasome-type protease [Acidimicrobiia bacterium]